eukprot:87644-Amphidinium_carterae.1
MASSAGGRRFCGDGRPYSPLSRAGAVICQYPNVADVRKCSGCALSSPAGIKLQMFTAHFAGIPRN